MRPRYGTSSIVLARSPHGEASASIALLTHEFGLVRARAQGVRKSGAKLASALQTLAECDAILVRGKDGWRLSGALLSRNRFAELPESARSRAGRVATLLLRLIQGETRDPELFTTFRTFLEVLPTLSDEEGDAAETLAVLMILRTLGLDAGELPEGASLFEKEALTAVTKDRSLYIRRVNHGLSASGL